MEFGAVILVGGASRRMGRDKARLTIDGESFLEKIANELSGFNELLLSVNKPEQYADEKITRVTDIFNGCGPMDGLFSALTACRSDALLAVSCDLPLFQRALGERLCTLMTASCDAVVPVTGGGRFHPLCAVYGKSAATIFETQLKSGNYRLTDAFEKLAVRYVSVADEGFSEACLQNINTVEDYIALNPGGR
jgi:molybdopterin-guanine dinucleotide biosynthesis protein A